MNKCYFYNCLKIFYWAFMVVLPSESVAQNVHTEHLSFDESMFHISCTDSICNINWDAECGSYGEDTTQPALPLVCKNYLVDKGTDVISTTYNIRKKSFVGVYNLDNNRPSFFIDENPSQSRCAHDTNKTYPFSNLQNIKTTNLRNHDLLSFQFVPFIYDARTDSLFLVEDVYVQFNSTASFWIAANNLDEMNDFDKTHKNGNPQQAGNEFVKGPPIEGGVNYVIITADSLKTAFDSLMEWKSMKGLRAEVVAVEDIYSNPEYSAANHPLQIKKFINHYDELYGTKYFLLGGDVEIVPTCICYGEYMNNGDTTWVYDMACDYFYECLFGSFNWDANNNGLIGEADDGINLCPAVEVSRIPVHTTTDIFAFTKKLICYEKGKLVDDDQYPNMLFAGAAIVPNSLYGGLSDSHYDSNHLFHDYVETVANNPVNKKSFFDTGVDILGVSSFSKSSFIDVLKRRWNIAHIGCHGWPFHFEFNQFQYNYFNAQLDTIHVPFMISGACHVNKFNHPLGNSLSEDMFLNPNSDLIGFIGNTDKGLIFRPNNYNYDGYYMMTTALFNKLYSVNNRFVGALNNARYQNFHSVGSISLWTIKTLNSLADPECPFYTIAPPTFNDVYGIINENNLTIVTNDSKTKLTIQDKSGGDTSYTRLKESRNYTINNAFTPLKRYGLYKDFFVPLVTDYHGFPLHYIQNNTFDSDFHLDGIQIVIGESVTDQVDTGDVVISNDSQLNIQYEDYLTITGGFECQKGGSFSFTPKYNAQ